MKKRFTAVIVTALVCWMIITSPAWAQTVNDLKLGDADGDGKTDINDALAVALYDCGMKIQNDMAGFTMADADCSGKVDIFDALIIAEFDAGAVKILECLECVQPSVPGGPGAVETEDMTSVNISWNAVPWAESYRLLRDASSEGSFTEEIYAGSDTSYNDSADSECGTACYYRVIAENSCGQSAKSDYASVESYSACYNLPSPGGLRASATGGTSVKINWNFVGLASSYRLYRDTSATGSFSSKIYEGTALSYTDTNLQCSTTYYYKVSAVNICSQQSPKSAYVSAKTNSCYTWTVRIPDDETIKLSSFRIVLNESNTVYLSKGQTYSWSTNNPLTVIEGRGSCCGWEGYYGILMNQTCEGEDYINVHYADVNCRNNVRVKICPKVDNPGYRYYDYGFCPDSE